MSQIDQEENLFDYCYDQPGSVPGILSISEDAVPSDITLID